MVVFIVIFMVCIIAGLFATMLKFVGDSEEKEFMENHMVSQGHTKVGEGKWRDRNGDIWSSTN